jgi:hypothetical protein
MGTVHFQCGNCGNLMAVPEDLLGQQVRCPSCLQVVQAPAAAPAPPPDLQPSFFTVPGSVEPDSIFTPPEMTDEDLFGGSPAPRLELPPAPPAPAVPPPPPVVEQPAAAPPSAAPPEPALAPGPTQEPTAPDLPPAEATALSTHPEPDGGPGSGLTGLSMLTAPGPDGPAAREPAAVGEEAAAGQVVVPDVARIRRAGGGWVVPILIVPLVLYSVLATIAVVYLLSMNALQPRPNPLEMLPDQGENPGASHQKRSIDFHQTPLLALPPYLRVKLGHSLTIGDIQVTPLRVELRPIVYRTEGFDRPEVSRGKSLVLWLELKNVSRDVVFRPMDRFFNRHWQKGAFESNVPFTYLETADRHRYYGGPELDDRQTVEGQDLDAVLHPGETLTTFVCTDPDDGDGAVGKEVRGARGPLLYRVRLRRGLVRVHNREVSATAVVGVEFSAADVAVKDTPAG